MNEIFFKFLGTEKTKSSFEFRTGVKGAACKFTDRNGSIHFRNGFGNEKIYSPATYRMYAVDKCGIVKSTDLFKNLFHLFGKLTPQKKENYVTNILTAIKAQDGCLGIANEVSKNFWIPDEELQKLNEIGAILSKYSDFQDSVDFF